MRAVCIVALLSLGVCPALSAQTPDHPLTLSEALETLHANNPVLLSVRAHTDAVKANEITAALRPNPVFSSANEDFRVFSPSQLDVANAQEFTDSVLQPIERGGKRKHRVESARWSTTLAEEAYRDIQRQLEFSLRATFTAMLVAKSNLELARQNVASYEETVRLNEIRLRAGDISRTDFDRIYTEKAHFETDLLNAQLGVAQARTQLKALLGRPELPDTFDIQGELLAPELQYSVDELVSKALVNRPDYLAARDGIQKAQAEVRLADANGATDIAVGGEYKRNGPDNTLGFTIQVPLRLFDRNQGEKLRTRRELDSSRKNETAAQVAVRNDVTQAYEVYRSALSRAQLYSKDYLERAKRVRDHVEFSYRHGGSSLLDYLDALRSYRSVELAWRSAYGDVMLAVDQLVLATGTELRP
jgi:cobalt-zinc-cadmium efflux system outer membrane protein